MDVQQSLLLAENGSLRLNLVYTTALVISLLSYIGSTGFFSFFFSFLGYLIVVLLIVAVFVLGFSTYMYLMSQWAVKNKHVEVDQEENIDIVDAEVLEKYKGEKMPMEEFIENYFDEKINLNKDLHAILLERNKLFSMSFTPPNFEFFIRKFLLQTILHSKDLDHYDVTTTYNRGNDFYNAFLGESMVYTSALYRDVEKETLEQAQENKINVVCKKIGMKAGDKHLDIGCGWGTFAIYAARNYKTHSTGVTIAEEQIKWANEEILAKDPLNDDDGTVNFLHMDYREIPDTKYDKITCLEMAEHVGVKNFQAFMKQVYGLLKDDGVFYLQICGLRPSWTYEDLIWGLFMAKYVFPAADASCPINWVLLQMEKAGFEIHQVENVTIHYSETIFRWYKNWISNESQMVEAYGERMFRVWSVFLAWSAIIASQGTSACYQIVGHKNTDTYDRYQYLSYGAPVIDQLD